MGGGRWCGVEMVVGAVVVLSNEVVVEEGGGYTISRLLAMALSYLARLKKSRDDSDLPALKSRVGHRAILPSPKTPLNFNMEFTLHLAHLDGYFILLFTWIALAFLSLHPYYNNLFAPLNIHKLSRQAPWYVRFLYPSIHITHPSHYLFLQLNYGFSPCL